MSHAHVVIYRLDGDRRRYQHEVQLAADHTWADVAAVVGAALGKAAKDVHVVAVSPVADGPVSLSARRTPDRRQATAGGPPARTRRRRKGPHLITTDTPPDQWLREVPYLEAMIRRLGERRKRAEARDDDTTAKLMADRLLDARVLLQEVRLHLVQQRIADDADDAGRPPR